MQQRETAVHERMSAKERRYLERARVCRVGSSDPGQQPHVAPLCHAFDPRTRIAYVVTGGVTARNLRRRRRAAIECDDYYEDWDRLRGLVAHARATLVRRGPELDRARQLLVRKYKQYREYEIDEVLALKVETVTSWGL
jgi:nitroimidazol reductase NimA-like FMN-containing flavoprotein (pyridoxamine 5'-phosphate oxidase superfamily)